MGELVVGRARFEVRHMPVRCKESELLDFDIRSLTGHQRGIGGDLSLMAGDCRLFLSRVGTGAWRQEPSLMFSDHHVRRVFHTLRELMEWAERNYLALHTMWTIDHHSKAWRPSLGLGLEADYEDMQAGIERHDEKWFRAATELFLAHPRTTLLLCPHCLMPTKRSEPRCLSCLKQIPPATHCRCGTWTDLPAKACRNCRRELTEPPQKPELAAQILRRGHDLAEIPNLAAVESKQAAPGWRSFEFGEYLITVRMPVGERKIDGFHASDYNRAGKPFNQAVACRVELGGKLVGDIILTRNIDGALFMTRPLGAQVGASTTHFPEALRLLLTDIVNWFDEPQAGEEITNGYMREAVMRSAPTF